VDARAGVRGRYAACVTPCSRSQSASFSSSAVTVPKLRISCCLPPFSLPDGTPVHALLVYVQTSVTLMNHLQWLCPFRVAPKEALLKENLLRVLAIQDGGDNSLCLQASKIRLLCGLLGTTHMTTTFRRTLDHSTPITVPHSCPLSGRRRRACALASVRRSKCTCRFPAYSFHEEALGRGR